MCSLKLLKRVFDEAEILDLIDGGPLPNAGAVAGKIGQA